MCVWMCHVCVCVPLDSVCVLRVCVCVWLPPGSVASFVCVCVAVQEEGICYPPFAESLAAAKSAAEARIRENWAAKLAELTKA